MNVPALVKIGGFDDPGVGETGILLYVSEEVAEVLDIGFEEMEGPLPTEEEGDWQEVQVQLDEETVTPCFSQ